MESGELRAERFNELAEENEILRRRLQHLLQSETVRMYDEIDPRTREYMRDIRQLDTIADHLIANGVRLEEKQATSQATSDESKRFAKDTNAPSNDVPDTNVGKWISVKERLPEERDSLFTSFYGTAKWQEGMFLKCSDTVLASVEYEDGKRRVKAIITKDGKWDIHNLFRASKVTHWMPLPEPPKGE